MNYQDIKKTLQTGDIILFKGSDWVADAIQLLEDAEGIPPASQYTHIGIVFIFPNGNPTTEILFWQAVPESDATKANPDDPLNLPGTGFGKDLIKNVESDGCVLVNLDKVMNWSRTYSKNPDIFSKLALRHIQPALSEDQTGIITNLEKFIRLIDGRSFSSPPVTGMPLDYTEGALLKKQTPNSTFFCSKLATLTLQYIGVLDTSIISNAILPADFGQDCENNKLVFTNGYSYGPEITFTLEEKIKT